MGCSDSKDAGKPAAPAAAATTDEATDLHKKEEILRKVRAEQARLVQEAERAHQQVMQMRDIEELSRRRRLECPTEAAPTEAGGSDGGDGPEAPVTAAAAAAAVERQQQQQQPLDLPMVEVTVAAPEEEHGREEDAAPADAGADNQLRPSIYRRGEGAAQHGASAYMLSTNMIAFDGAPDPTSCVMYLPDDFGNGSDDDTAADDELVVTHGWKEKEAASA